MFLMWKRPSSIANAVKLRLNQIVDFNASKITAK